LQSLKHRHSRHRNLRKRELRTYGQATPRFIAINQKLPDFDLRAMARGSAELRRG
jgi:hypothetical protein